MGNANPWGTAVWDLPLAQVMRGELALSLASLLNIYTVGALLQAWRRQPAQEAIEQVFDTPEQARHAISVLYSWMDFDVPPTAVPVPEWWIDEAPSATPAQ